MITLSLYLILTIINFTNESLLDYTETNWPTSCKLGQNGSPIDFPIKTSSSYINSTEYFKIISTNYTITSNRSFGIMDGWKFHVDLNEMGFVTISKNGINYRYNCLEMHFHTNSEHTFQGLNHDMELHIVHTKDLEWLKEQGITNDPDNANSHLVIGILFKSGTTATNSIISKFDIKNLGLITNLDLNTFYKSSNNFFHYKGGLTSPNCNEFVNWVVMENVQSMSDIQFLEIKNWVKQIYPNGNYRKTRPLNNRVIYYARNNTLITTTEMNFSMIIVAMAAMFIIFFFRKKFDII